MTILPLSALRLHRHFLRLLVAIASLAGARLSSAEALNTDPVTKIYLEMDGISGDVTDPGFEGQIEVISYSWGANPGVSGSSRAEGGEISFTKYLDSSSAKLFLVATSGNQLKAATLRIVQMVDGAVDSMMTIDLRRVIITAVQIAGETESITLSSERSKITGTVNTEPITKIYLDIKGIAGDVTDPGFEGQIEVISYSWGVGGPGLGEAGEISLIKYIDSSSANLLSIANSGEYLKAAALRVVQTVNGAIDSMTITDLQDVLITAVVIANETEAITLTFERSKISH
jgi:type VI secretion system secreted protein Hcp